MTYVPIERVDIESYGCIKKASFALSPLHALIGPNDSGKSTKDADATAGQRVHPKRG